MKDEYTWTEVKSLLNEHAESMDVNAPKDGIKRFMEDTFTVAVSDAKHRRCVTSSLESESDLDQLYDLWTDWLYANGGAELPRP